jgi:hypothetical protein
MSMDVLIVAGRDSSEMPMNNNGWQVGQWWLALDIIGEILAPHIHLRGL